MIYRLTAVIDLKYRLREAPSAKEAFLIKAGKHILILKSVYPFLHLINAKTGAAATPKDFTLQATA